MISIDKIIFGDNQFFGINHMSQEKAQILSEKFFDLSSILNVYDIAISSGIKGIMLNSNDRAKEICQYFRDNKSKYSNLNWYPSIPYPHKYANLISEKGIIASINEVLFKESSASGTLGMLTKGGSALINKDAIKLFQMLIEVEMKTFKSLNVKVIFLQNIITDLLLGYDLKDIFYEYCEFIRKKYNSTPGLITQNMPILKSKLEEWGLEEIVICSSFNKIGYLMSPNIESYINAANNNNISKYQLMAMSTMSSGSISPDEAFEFIKKQNIQSVVFGASSKNHIQQTTSILKKSK
jgi:hypothetical protein